MKAPAFALAALLVAGLASSAPAATFTLVNMDAAGTGLNDPTVVAAVTGNPATTLGQQRQNVFLAAFDYWGARLQSAVPIRVRASFASLPCDATGAILGSAGPMYLTRDFSGAPRAGTYYVNAEANALAGSDLGVGVDDISAQFNKDIGSAGCLPTQSWYYGIGSSAPVFQISFHSVILHELGHGLGFLTAVDPSTGAKFFGYDDAFMVNLEDHSLGMTWPTMSNAQRLSSWVDTGDLHWVGTNVVARAGSVLTSGLGTSNHVKMYAPFPAKEGSSVSHWDTTLSPNEIMEPIHNSDAANLLTTLALQDIGWNLVPLTGSCVSSATTLCLPGTTPGDNRFSITASYSTVQGGGSSGSGRAIVTSSLGVTSGGMFWFFSPDNPELLIKVLNGCGIDNKFWVMGSAGTTVGLTITVRDTIGGGQKVYTNPDLTAALPFVDKPFSCP